MKNNVIARPEGPKQSQKWDCSPSGEAAGFVAPSELLAMTNKIARLDAEIILAHLLEVSRPELYIYDKAIRPDVLDRFDALVEERTSGRPLQYILGKTEFMGFDLKVTPDVFIPRPETELLVEEAKKIVLSMAGLENPAYPAWDGLYPSKDRRDIHVPHILDLGTGSGNIAISLTKFIADCKILASDVSAGALSVARENAKRLLVDKRIDFVLSDLFARLPKAKFDMIVSNPPYVASAEFGELAREISFEPKIALDGGQAGIDVYKRIIKEATGFLSTGGYLVLEIGYDQSKKIIALFETHHYTNISFRKDYNGIKRVAVGQFRKADG